MVFSLDKGIGTIFSPFIGVIGKEDDPGSGVVISFLVVISVETAGLVESGGRLFFSSLEPNEAEIVSVVEAGEGTAFSVVRDFAGVDLSLVEADEGLDLSLVVLLVEAGGVIVSSLFVFLLAKSNEDLVFSLVEVGGIVVISLVKFDGGVVLSSAEPKEVEVDSTVDDAECVVFSLAEPGKAEIVSLVGEGGRFFFLLDDAGECAIFSSVDASRGFFSSSLEPNEAEMVSDVVAGGGVVFSLVEAGKLEVFSLGEAAVGVVFSLVVFLFAEFDRVLSVEAGLAVKFLLTCPGCSVDATVALDENELRDGLSLLDGISGKVFPSIFFPDCLGL